MHSRFPTHAQPGSTRTRTVETRTRIHIHEHLLQPPPPTDIAVHPFTASPGRAGVDFAQPGFARRARPYACTNARTLPVPLLPPIYTHRTRFYTYNTRTPAFPSPTPFDFPVRSGQHSTAHTRLPTRRSHGRIWSTTATRLQAVLFRPRFARR